MNTNTIMSAQIFEFWESLQSSIFAVSYVLMALNLIFRPSIISITNTGMGTGTLMP